MGPGGSVGAQHTSPGSRRPWSTRPSAALPASSLQEPSPAQAETQLEKLWEEGPNLAREEAPSLLPPNPDLKAQQSSRNTG